MTTTFDPIATRVLQHVVLRRWLARLSGTWPWASLVIGVLVVAHWSYGLPSVLAWFAGLFWLVGTAAYVWQQRPVKYSALALWDQAAGRSEAVAAAYWFAQQPQRTATEQQHIDSQQDIARHSLGSLSQHLPLVFSRWLWVPLAALLLSFLSPFAPRPTLADEPLSDAMRDTAKAEARKLDEPQKQNLQGLKPAEKAAVEALHQQLKETAKDLANSDGKSARDVLSQLERRANEAEKLARQLGSEHDAWASDQVIQALRKHADTADLGDAVANKNTTQAATAATQLAAQLQSPQLSAEARTRFAEALADTAKQSDANDRKRLVGGPVLSASDKLQASDAIGAAGEFQALADSLKNQAQRDKAKQQLEQLAQQLRDSGSRITGQEKGAMQPMQAAGQQGNPQPMQQGQSGQKLTQQNTNSQQLQSPGLGQPQSMSQQSNKPGDGQQGQQQTLQMAQQQPGAPSDGSEPKDSGKPTLFAPDPSKKDQPSSGPDILVKGDSDANSGQAVAMPSSGLKAGQGTAALEGDKTLQTKAKGSSVVQAQNGKDGPSSTRSVEGGIRDETATRNAAQTPSEFIQQEEAALTDSPLPAARREQVRRYFNELRKRFEPKP